MKKCAGCGQEKPLTEEFWPIRERKNGVVKFRSKCKVCQNRINRNFYESSSATKESARKRAKASKQAIQQMLRSHKIAQGCMDCRAAGDLDAWPHEALDFDHRPGETKLFILGDAAYNTGINSVKAELAKCDVVCANHHRIRTYTRKEMTNGN